MDGEPIEGMTLPFAKPISDLTSEDLANVVAEQVPESETVELKSALPVKSGDEHVWVTQRTITDKARNELIAEIIAFANAHGGWLLLGVQESSDLPEAASHLTPVSHCTEMEERFRHQCRDWYRASNPKPSGQGNCDPR